MAWLASGLSGFSIFKSYINASFYVFLCHWKYLLTVKSDRHKDGCYLKHIFGVGMTVCLPRSGELRTQKLKSHLVRTQSLNVLPLKSGVGQYFIAIHATLTARNFFLAYFFPSGPFTCIFSKTSPDFVLVLAVANTGSCVGLQNKIGHPAGCRFPCWAPTEYR